MNHSSDQLLAGDAIEAAQIAALERVVEAQREFIETGNELVVALLVSRFVKGQINRDQIFTMIAQGQVPQIDDEELEVSVQTADAFLQRAVSDHNAVAQELTAAQQVADAIQALPA